MALTDPLPDLLEILESIGQGGLRLASIDATEGAAGNITVCVGWPLEVRRHFPIREEIELPLPAPHLAGRRLIVTGSGRRLRDIAQRPLANLGVVIVDEAGLRGILHTSYDRLFAGLTSEWNSHLAVHDDTVARTGTNYHAVVQTP
jgi:rhamnulose-1-phosphate aldolase